MVSSAIKKLNVLETCTPLCVYAVDAQNRLIFTNKTFREKTGWKKNELEGWIPPFPFWPEGLHAKWSRLHQQCMNGGPAEEAEILIQCKGMKNFWGVVDGGKLHGEDGSMDGALFSIFDISPRKQIEKAYARSEDQRKRLIRMLIDAQEKERKRISRELHDNICSSLTAVKLALEQKLKMLDRGSDPGDGMSVEYILSMLQTVLQETRQMSKQLHPSLLKSTGLTSALQSLCEDYRMVRPDIHFELGANIFEEDLPEHLGILIYRLVQEAVNNALKYSGGDHVCISLSQSQRGVALSVSDNGKGFDLKKKSMGNGLGLMNMRERTTLSGGRFNIDAAEGRGVTVSAQWLLEKVIQVN